MHVLTGWAENAPTSVRVPGIAALDNLWNRDPSHGCPDTLPACRDSRKNRDLRTCLSSQRSFYRGITTGLGSGIDQLSTRFLYSLFPDFEKDANRLMMQQAGLSVIHAVAISAIVLLVLEEWYEIAIAGAGIAGGTWQSSSIQKGISPDIYDGMDHDTRCRCRSCGWGVPRGIGTYLAEVGLDFNDYLLESMPSMNFDDLVAKTPLCTLNKPRLIRDFTQGYRSETAEPGAGGGRRL